MLLLVCIVTLVTTTAQAAENLKVLRPCFERYTNHRLVNLKPYHSEWRMKTEDSCLKFCAQTSSRCRSVVHDSVQHICHFFLDEGDEHAVIAAKMTFLRVTNKTCLDEARQRMYTPAYPTRRPSTLMLPTLATLEPFTWTTAPSTLPPSTQETTTLSNLDLDLLDLNNLDRMIETATEGQLPPEDADLLGNTLSEPSREELEQQNRNEVMRDLKNFGDQEKRWQSSMEALVRKSDDLGFKPKPTFPPRSTVPLGSKFSDKLAMRKTTKGNSFKRFSSTKFVEISKSKEERMLEEALNKEKDSFAASLKPESEFIDPTNVLNIVTTTTTEEPKPLNFNGGAIFGINKFNEVRRAPIAKRPKLKQVFTPVAMEEATESSDSVTSFKDKAQSFLDSVQPSALSRPIEVIPRKSLSVSVSKSKNNANNGCTYGKMPVWITFENSIDGMQKGIDSSFTENKEQCKELCNEQKCTSFTFFDVQSQCQVNAESDGVFLRESHGGDNTASTSTKFCFSDSLTIFRGCSNFVGFRDFSVEVTPKEQFDGLPIGYDGMQMCVELCVLSTEFTCRSAAFNVETGRCTLNADDSLSAPEAFKPNDLDSLLYFENGCSSASVLTRKEKKSMTVVRVPNVKKSPLKSLQIKKLRKNRKMKRVRRIRRSVENFEGNNQL